MKRLIAVVAALLSLTANLAAQHTFSIVAVDTVTGEVGSAGASCVPFDVAIISDLAPGVGAINSQASHNPTNQQYAGQLMRRGIAPQAIIDSLLLHDVQDSPALRQYGIAILADGGSTAAHTGEFANDYKGHRLGKTYAVQGNILLGSEIIDSMAARFERSTGSLAERLMFTLLGARVAGADARCAAYGTSSLGAYLQVARPGDRSDSILIDLRASIPTGTREPIDSVLQLFNAWKVASVDAEQSISAVAFRTATLSKDVVINFELLLRVEVRVDIYDITGAVVARQSLTSLEPGDHELRLTVPHGGSSSLLFARLSSGRDVFTHALRFIR